MNDKINVPTLSELIDSGYVVNIKHNRNHRVAFTNPTNGKLVVKVVTGYENLIPPPKDGMEDSITILSETLPTGGKTEVWVTDPDTSTEFYGFAKCHKKDNYNKRVGINICLERITQLMLVCDGKEGFKMKLRC